MVKEALFSGPEGNEFSASSIQALDEAHHEALGHNHNYIGTEHILLGLLNNQEIGQIFNRHDVEVLSVRAAIEFLIGKGYRKFTQAIYPTARGKKVIDFASQHASRANRDKIQPIDLLVGLSREGEGIAAGVMENLGVTYEKLINDPEIQNFKDKKRDCIDELIQVLDDPNVPESKKDTAVSVVRGITKMLRDQ